MIKYVYCICRIDKKSYPYIDKDLVAKGYTNITSFVPTIQVLRSSKHGKNTYTTSPLLFNYGFIKMKSELAFDRYFLNKLRRDIPGISSWVRSLETMHPKKKKLRVDNPEIFDDFSKVSLATLKEIRYYRKVSKRNRVYSIDQLGTLEVGKTIILRGYPFEGIMAEIIEVDRSRQYLMVDIPTTTMSRVSNIRVDIPFDHALYSIYNDYDEDRLSCSNNSSASERVTEVSIDSLLDNKQY